MKLTPPKTVTFWISLILGVLGILGTLTNISFVTPNAFWFLAVGFILLVLSVLVKGL